uniref:Uncharacterized protein n=1 Tax=Medicago truncatula TaxID=3880 RepID=I3SFG2_MEDTR|nr:unknown [Medicago truncatula]
MDTSLENTLILTNTSATNTSMNLNTKVVTKCSHNLLNLLCQLPCWGQNQSLALNQTIIKLLQNSRTERRCLSGS